MVTKFLFILLPFCLIGSEGWEPTHLIWNFGIISSCDVGAPRDPEDYFSKDEPTFEPKKYETVQRGDILWVQPHLLSAFYEETFPHIQVPFVLVISDGDASFPADCLSPDQLEGLLASERVLHIFAQNCVYEGPSQKISPIPIGIDFHTVAYKSKAGGWGMMGSPQQQEAILLDVAQTAPPTSQRKLKAFVDFQHSDTMHASFQRYLQFGEDRTSIFNRLVTTGLVDHGPWMRRGDLWKTKSQYAFSISPHGNGFDCHRTWEDLALGCIVIVKSSPLDPLYEGLPVVIVKDWGEINEANLQKWIREYGDVSTNPTYREKLSFKYWMGKIQKARRYHLVAPQEISYSQADCLGVPLDHKIIDRMGIKKGTFLEVGAFDGVIQSNTKLLEELYGWKGVLVEPSAVLQKRLMNNRPHSQCFQCALGSMEQDQTYIYGNFSGSLMSSVDGQREHALAKERVLIRSLQSILDEIHLRHVNFFSLDVEGYELNILKGIDFKKTSFDYILIEIYASIYNEVVETLRQHGYLLVENFSNYNPLTNPDWDGTHNDYLFVNAALNAHTQAAGR